MFAGIVSDVGEVMEMTSLAERNGPTIADDREPLRCRLS
jgi:hypothetical protein